jgi:hypothetical protein
MAVGATRQLLGALLQRVAGPVRFQVAHSDSGSGHATTRRTGLGRSRAAPPALASLPGRQCLLTCAIPVRFKVACERCTRLRQRERPHALLPAQAVPARYLQLYVHRHAVAARGRRVEWRAVACPESGCGARVSACASCPATSAASAHTARPAAGSLRIGSGNIGYERILTNVGIWLLSKRTLIKWGTTRGKPDLE